MPARPPLVDPWGHPLVPFSIVEVRYRGSWRRGRLVAVLRKRVVVEGFYLRRPGLFTSYRRPQQVYVVRSA